MIELTGSDRFSDDLDGDRALDVIVRSRRVARDLLERFSGREIDESRRFLLLFERPLDAIGYCVACHRAMASLARELYIALAARAGVHLGEVFLWENHPEDVARGAKPLEIEGPSRSIVERLLSLASEGQILLSKTTADLAQRAAVGAEGLEDELVWRSHGPYRFAGVEEALEVFEVGVESVAPFTAPRRATGVTRVGDDAWHPGPGKPIPHRPNWMLERSLENLTYGEVWLGKHRKTGDRRAFRFCSNANELPRMQRQLAVVRHLMNSAADRQIVVPTVDSQLQEAPYFLESEHFDGDTLAEWAQARGDLGNVPLESRLEIVAKLAEVVAAAHGAGVAVDNVEPRSVLVRERSGGVDSVLVADLSLARIIGGTPEIECRTATPQGDMRALGILLYQMAAGDLDRPLGPFWERDVDDKRLRREIAILADPDPQARPTDAAEVARRLRDLGRERADDRDDSPSEPAQQQSPGLLRGLLGRRRPS